MSPNLTKQCILHFHKKQWWKVWIGSLKRVVSIWKHILSICYCCILFFCMLRKNKLFTTLKFLRKCFLGQPKFSITAQRKLKSAPALCVIDIFEMFLMLLTAPQGLKIHTINIFKYQIFLTGFRWAKIFHHGATKTPIVGNPAKPISNDQLLLKKLRNNDKTLCSSLSYNKKIRSFLSTDLLGGCLLYYTWFKCIKRIMKV